MRQKQLRAILIFLITPTTTWHDCFEANLVLLFASSSKFKPSVYVDEFSKYHSGVFVFFTCRCNPAFGRVYPNWEKDHNSYEHLSLQ